MECCREKGGQKLPAFHALYYFLFFLCRLLFSSFFLYCFLCTTTGSTCHYHHPPSSVLLLAELHRIFQSCGSAARSNDSPDVHSSTPSSATNLTGSIEGIIFLVKKKLIFLSRRSGSTAFHLQPWGSPTTRHRHVLEYGHCDTEFTRTKRRLPFLPEYAIDQRYCISYEWGEWKAERPRD